MKENIVITQYKGYTIKFSETNGFTGEGELPPGWFDTLKGLKDKIDRLAKAESKGQFPIAVYKVSGSITLGKITSMNTEDKSAWFVDEKGNRQKLSHYNTVYAVNENNSAIANQVGQLRQTILECEAKQKQLIITLTDKISIGQKEG